MYVGSLQKRAELNERLQEYGLGGEGEPPTRGYKCVFKHHCTYQCAHVTMTSPQTGSFFFVQLSCASIPYAVALPTESTDSILMYERGSAHYWLVVVNHCSRSYTLSLENSAVFTTTQS